jgi:hypothetical protein
MDASINEENRTENIVEEHRNEEQIDFNDINYDPGTWKNIDQQMRDLLVEKGPIRKYDINFPKDNLGRHFSFTHYTRHSINEDKHDRKWLVYSKSLDKVFCFCCKLFKKDRMGTQLANDGINDWRNLSSKLKSHETSSEHCMNVGAWVELETRLQKNITIDKDVQNQINREKEYWKEVLVRIIDAVKYLARTNQAFRGDNEKIYDENNGNFCQLIQAFVEFDPVMKEHVRRIQNREIHHHYLSHKIQNELILLLASEIKSAIVKRIKEAEYFLVILDCTPDVNHEEQMSLIIRCVEVSTSPIKVKEFVLGFLKVDDTSGLGLFNKLKEVLETLGLDIENIRVQGYDNGSNMRGKNRGVQKRLLELNPRAFYTSCGCH